MPILETFKFHCTQFGADCRDQIRKFAHDTSGTITVEAVLILPILIWAYAGMFSFFNAYRAQNVNLRAAYTLSDLVTRKVDPMNVNYLNGLNTIYDFLISAPHPTWIRVTEISWSADEDRFNVIWSQATKGRTGWTTTSLNDERGDELPILADKTHAIIVEASTYYTPFFSSSRFNMLMDPVNFDNFIVTSLRTVPAVCWIDDVNCHDF